MHWLNLRDSDIAEADKSMLIALSTCRWIPNGRRHFFIRGQTANRGPQAAGRNLFATQ